MSYVITLIYIYIAFYTFKIGKAEWKGGNKFASINIMILVISIMVACIWVEFFKPYAN